MMDIEKILAPLSPENPCGEDISYAPDFMELDAMVLGKPATQFSEAVEPDWKAVQKRCEELGKRSKHLRVLTIFCLSALKLDGMPGVAASLELLSKSTQQYWNTIYPLLDPDDNLDPLERVNILSALASPVGTYGDPFKYLEKLTTVPLTQSSSFGRYTFATLPPRSSGEKTTEVSQAEAAFQDTAPETLQTIFSAIDRSIQAVNDLEIFLDTTIGASKSPNLEVLSHLLLDIRKAAGAYWTDNPSPSTPDDQQTASTQNSPSSGTNKSSGGSGDVGGIHSRKDVTKAVDLICDYYRTSEPSSPVPLLLRRAQRLVEGDFLAIIDDLAPESLAQLRTVTGVKETP